MARNKKYYTNLSNYLIIGYVDGYDAVHSTKIPFESYDGLTHGDLYGPCLKGWRWDFDNGLKFSILAGRLDEEDADRVREHLTKRYKIPFYENGFHDVMFFVDMMKKENEE